MKTYLYRCWDAQNQLLYVGIGEDVDIRLAVHRREKYWWSDVDRVTRMAFQSRLEAEWAEWAVITTCQPLYNRASPPPRMPVDTTDKSNVPSASPVDQKQVKARFAEHILAVTDVHPRWWASELPSVRQVKAAIGAVRASRGATFNSVSTTQRVLDAMKTIAAGADPERFIESLRSSEVVNST